MNEVKAVEGFLVRAFALEARGGAKAGQVTSRTCLPARSKTRTTVAASFR